MNKRCIYHVLMDVDILDIDKYNLDGKMIYEKDVKYDIEADDGFTACRIAYNKMEDRLRANGHFHYKIHNIRNYISGSLTTITCSTDLSNRKERHHMEDSNKKRWYTININYTITVYHIDHSFSYNGSMSFHKTSYTEKDLELAKEICISEVKYQYRDALNININITNTTVTTEE